MISVEQINSTQNADIRTVDRNTLVDIQGSPFGSSLFKRERIELVIKRTKNPCYFRCGELGARVKFADDDPTLRELLTNFLSRRKSDL